MEPVQQGQALQWEKELGPAVIEMLQPEVRSQEQGQIMEIFRETFLKGDSSVLYGLRGESARCAIDIMYGVSEPVDLLSYLSIYSRHFIG